jgi:hypothetical protein
MKGKGVVTFVTKHERNATNILDHSSMETLLLALHFSNFRQSKQPMILTW